MYDEVVNDDVVSEPESTVEGPQMEDLLETLVKGLVDKPEEVTVEGFDESDGSVTLELRVAEDEAGKVIGRGGRTINALASGRSFAQGSPRPQGRRRPRRLIFRSPSFYVERRRPDHDRGHRQAARGSRWLLPGWRHRRARDGCRVRGADQRLCNTPSSPAAGSTSGRC